MKGTGTVKRRRLGTYMVAPVGLGAMRLTGPNVFGPPGDRAAAIALLRAAVDSGVDHIDTAQYYGPNIVNDLICEALHPYPPELVLVSKVGARRDSRGGILVADDPAQLRQGIEDNLRTLQVDQLAVVNLRRMRDDGPDAFFDDQLAAMISARDDGLIAAVGLSNVTLPHVLHALRFTELACVQNAFHLANRRSRSVLDECTRRNIAFVPFAPLGSGRAGAAAVLSTPEVVGIATRMRCTPAEVALAWALTFPNVLLIPGTSSMRHLRENLAASAVQLDAEALRQLARMGDASPV
ncbi:MAG: aldo/keto reductase [Actinomycetia bacterium]|nr:aldo/keto reductase [Actinomycetes bacterium]